MFYLGYDDRSYRYERGGMKHQDQYRSKVVVTGNVVCVLSVEEACQSRHRYMTASEKGCDHFKVRVNCDPPMCARKP